MNTLISGGIGFVDERLRRALVQKRIRYQLPHAQLMSMSQTDQAFEQLRENT